MATDRRTIRGPLYQALEPIVRDSPRITPEHALERLQEDPDTDALLQNYSQPLSAIRRTLRELKT